MCNTLLQRINTSTCLKIIQALLVFHDKPLYREIYDLADAFWLENTLLCSQNKSYLELPWSVVSHLLSRSEYNDEKIVFAAAINWFEYNTVCRTKHVEEFLTTVVRLPQLTPVFLTGVVACHPFLKACSATKLEHLVSEALVYQTTRSARKKLIASGELRYLKRKGWKSTTMVQYVSMYHGIEKATFLSTDRPLITTPYDGTAQNRYYHGVSTLNGKMYVFGGILSHPHDETFSSIEEFDEQTQTWQMISATMTAPRFAMTTIGTS